MNNILASNIVKLRKEKNYTQEELAKKLNVSFQAVSKWENGISYPDITILSDLAYALDSDINSLMGYIYNKNKITIYEDEYKKGDSYYWGVVPNKMCYRVLELKPPTKHLKILDIGCGEGKDAVFFAKNGYDVTAFDITDSGVEKTKRIAELNRVNINVFKANALDFRLDTEFDIVFSSGVFHYIPLDLRNEIISNYIENTTVGGLHVFNVFVNKPFISQPPEEEPASYAWKSGELFLYYTDWLIHSCSEIIFDCNSSGIPHKHCMDYLITEKII